MLWLVLLNIRLAFIALANRLACKYVSNRGKKNEDHTYLDRYLLLILTGKVHKVIILGAHQEGDGCLIEATSLAIPLLNRIQCTLASEIKHEKNCNSVIADKR